MGFEARDHLGGSVSTSKVRCRRSIQMHQAEALFFFVSLAMFSESQVLGAVEVFSGYSVGDEQSLNLAIKKCLSLAVKKSQEK